MTEPRLEIDLSWQGEGYCFSRPNGLYLGNEDFALVWRWCKDTYGDADVRWWTDRQSFFIENEKDAAMFRMRWC